MGHIVELDEELIETGLFDLLMYYKVESRITPAALAERLTTRVVNDLIRADRDRSLFDSDAETAVVDGL